MAWTYLLMASGFEILFPLGLKYAEGFTRLGWSVLTVAAGVTSFLILSQALRTLPVGTGYAVWTGIGACRRHHPRHLPLSRTARRGPPCLHRVDYQRHRRPTTDVGHQGLNGNPTITCSRTVQRSRSTPPIPATPPPTSTITKARKVWRRAHGLRCAWRRCQQTGRRADSSTKMAHCRGRARGRGALTIHATMAEKS
jgi:hypothetical protein